MVDPKCYGRVGREVFPKSESKSVPKKCTTQGCKGVDQTAFPKSGLQSGPKSGQNMVVMIWIEELSQRVDQIVDQRLDQEVSRGCGPKSVPKDWTKEWDQRADQRADQRVFPKSGPKSVPQKWTKEWS